MHSTTVTLSRGRLARQSGVNSETIRYYENIGLMPDPARSAGGHRVYNRSHLRRLSFIRRARELGFSLQEIRGLLEMADGGDFTCAEVRDRTVVHLRDVEQRIRDLQSMKRSLETMISKCEGGLVPECAIMERLFSD